MLIKTLLLAPSLALLVTPASAQRTPRDGGRSTPKGAVEVHVAPDAAGIAWFGTWSGALAEAKRTGRPILFMSAAPQCRNVPGVW